MLGTHIQEPLGAQIPVPCSGTALSLTSREIYTYCLHGGGFVLTLSSLGLEYSLQLAGHVDFPVCDMNPGLINDDSKYSHCVRSTVNLREQSHSQFLKTALFHSWGTDYLSGLEIGLVIEFFS